MVRRAYTGFVKGSAKPVGNALIAGGSSGLGERGTSRGGRRGGHGGRYGGHGNGRGGAAAGGNNSDGAVSNNCGNGQSKSSSGEKFMTGKCGRLKLPGHWWTECEARVIPSPGQAAAAAGSSGDKVS